MKSDAGNSDSEVVSVTDGATQESTGWRPKKRPKVSTPDNKDNADVSMEEMVHELLSEMTELRKEMAEMRELIKTDVGEMIKAEMSVVNEKIEEMRDGIREELRNQAADFDQRLQQMNERMEKNENELKITNKKIKELASTKITDNIRNELDILRRETHDQIKSIKTESCAQKKSTQEKTSAHVKLTNEMDQLKADRLEHNRKLIDLESRSRRNNLLFFGIKESADEDPEDRVSKFLKEQMKIDCPVVFDRVHRHGAPRKNFIGTGALRPRPIIAAFADFKVKELVRGKRHNLTSPYGVSNDFPAAVRKARKTVLNELKELKKSDPRAAIVYPCKLISKGAVVKNIDVAKFFDTK